MQPHNPLPPIFIVWQAELNQIVNIELGLDLDDLPDTPTHDDYESGITPQEAFEIYRANYWDLQNFLSDYCTDEPDTDPSGQCYTDADEGL